MASNGFEARVRQREGETAVVDMVGEVNAQAEAALDAAYASAAEFNATSIVLNFEHVEYMNSTGIALVVGLLARAKKDRRDIMACGLSDHYRKIFEITRVSDFMHVYDSEESAVGDSARAG
jgi:anti-sigma B factor antagonist